MSVLNFHVIPTKVDYQPETRRFVDTCWPSLDNDQGVRYCLDRNEKDYWFEKDKKNKLVLLSDVATSFINLRHANHNQIKQFFEEFGMLGKLIECDRELNLKEGFSESHDDITKKIDKYCNSFTELSKLKANHPSFDSDSGDDIFAMYIVSDSINKGVSNLKHSLTIDAADDNPFFTEYLTCESLLHALYYFLYQNAIHDWYNYSVCVDCGKRFLSSKRKKIDNLCPDCIERNRIIRNKEQQRGNPKQYFREIINNRAYWYYGKPIYKDVLKTWLAAFNRQHEEMKHKSDHEFDLWKDEINKEWKKMTKDYKASYKEVK